MSGKDAQMPFFQQPRGNLPGLVLPMPEKRGQERGEDGEAGEQDTVMQAGQLWWKAIAPAEQNADELFLT